MTDAPKTFTFTIEQIKDIYRAGIRRGSEEECSYQCGSSATGRTYDNCIDAIHDIVNEGKQYDHPEYKDWDKISDWFKRG